MTTATRVGFELDAAIESYRRNRRTVLAEQTLDRVYVPRLRQLAAWLNAQGMPTDVGSVRREHLEAYIEHLQTDAPGRGGAGQKSATVSITYRTMRTFFRWLVAEEEIARSPMERMQAPAVVEEPPLVLTADQLAKLYKVCGGRGFEDRRDLALVRLLADSGMRRGEVAALTVDDLHLDGDGLILLRGDTSKSRRGRVVPLSREAVGSLDRYLRVRHSHPHAGLPWLWLGKRGRLTDSGILQIVERRGRQAGIPGLHPHRFRHTFAHAMLVGGMTEGAVAALAGWKDRAMLARYGRSAAVERAVAEFRRLDGMG
jgi:site-specific recombinase XerD